MIRILTTLAVSVFTTIASAQDPVVLVDAAGGALPLTSFALGPLALSPTADVYASLDPSLPSGYYMFDVLDVNFQQLSLLPIEDRIFYAQNTGTGFAITRVSGTPGLPPLGVGLGGLGNSMPLSPFASPLTPGFDCIHKAIVRTLGAVLPPIVIGNETLAGTRSFRVGDGSLGSVAGVVFEDSNQNGARDLGEPGVAGCPIKLIVDNVEVNSTSTGADGSYLLAFPQPLNGECSVTLSLNTQLYVATTPTDVPLSGCSCTNSIVNFGKYTIQQACVGRTPGFWRNNNGVAIIVNGSFWDELAALNLVNGSGAAFDPTGNVQQWRTWLQQANATNMAYMLSAHLAAMKLNVLSGGVGPNCWVSTPQGPMQIGALLVLANQAIAEDPYTPAGDPNRAAQEMLKNVLDAANNNLNWL